MSNYEFIGADTDPGAKSIPIPPPPAQHYSAETVAGEPHVLYAFFITISFIAVVIRLLWLLWMQQRNVSPPKQFHSVPPYPANEFPMPHHDHRVLWRGPPGRRSHSNYDPNYEPGVY